MFYHVSKTLGCGESSVQRRNEAGCRDEGLPLTPSSCCALPCLHLTFPADLPGARDPAAPALLRPQPAQHGEAEALH